MVFKYAEKTSHLNLSASALDDYLARGWYRMGGAIFTTHFLFFQGHPYSAVWVRLDLENFQFSRSQRKLMRRNAKLFTTATGPITIDREREELFSRYAQDFDGQLSPTVRDSLEHYGEAGTIFNTWETTIRERQSGQLIGNSYFDLGAETAASIIGIFDPLLKTFSLGYYTMLLEIEYCLERGMRYYYPGYVVPGYQRFDYKLRIGPCEYLRVDTMSWEPYREEVVRRDGPVELQRRRLEELAAGLEAGGYQFRPLIYPLFEAGLYDVWTDNYFPYPLCMPLLRLEDDDLLVLAFDPHTRQYLLCYCHHMIQTQMMFNSGYLANFRSEAYFADLISIGAVQFQTASQEQMTTLCLDLLQHSA